MTRHHVKILLYSCLFLLLAGVINAAVWRVTNRRITKDGEPFTVKGVNYAPLPPGSRPEEGTQWGDLFHADWEHLHDRDIPLLRAAGVNSIRVYHLQLTYPNSDMPLDHVSFFDKLYNNGNDPIYIFITYALGAEFAYLGPFDSRPDTEEYAFQTTDGKWFTLDPVADEQNAARREVEKNIMVDIAARYRDHPAVMGFVIGNEQNDAITRSNCKYWEWLEEIDAAVKQQAPNLLTATTIVDDAMITVEEATRCNSLTHMDVWGINSYRGTATTGFDSLFTDFAALSTKGLLITEFGCPASTRVSDSFAMLPENSRLQADYLEAHWSDMMDNIEICSGGHVFSWIDEWWKNSAPSEQTPNNLAQNFAFPGQWADEEAWGLLAVVVDCDEISNWAARVDQVVPRATYYVMGQLFGAWDTVPANGQYGVSGLIHWLTVSAAFEPVNYPRCNGEWIGTPGAPNPSPSIPLPVSPVSTGPVQSTPMADSPAVLAVPSVDRDQTSSALRCYYDTGVMLALFTLLQFFTLYGK